MTNKTARLAKVGLSVAVGLLGLAVVMAILSMAGSAAARPAAGEDPGDVGPLSTVSTITVGAKPVSITVGGYTSTITATVEGSSPVTDTFVSFTTTLGSITPPYWYVEAEDASKVTRAGSWTVGSWGGASNGQYLYSNQTGAAVTYTFTGTSVALIYTKGPDEGKAHIYIDNTLVMTVDMYAPTGVELWERWWGQEELITTTLTPDMHTIRVQVSGLKNPSSSNTFIYVDAFKSGVTTDISGVVTCTLISGPQKGVATVTAQADSVTGTTQVTFTADSPFTVTAGASPKKIPINGYTTTITATIKDQFGNLVEDNTPVTFTTNLGGFSPAVMTNTTTVNGVATATLTSGPTPGTATITATANTTATGTTQVEFTTYILIDDGDPQYSSTGTWNSGSDCGGIYNDFQWSSDPGAIARWTPNFVDDGNYEVYVHWVVSSTWSNAAVYTITHKGGTTTKVVDQTKDSQGNAGDCIASGWKSLGIYGFNAGTGGYVELSPSSKVCADAVKFISRLPPHSIQVTANPTSIQVGGHTSIISATVKDRNDNFVGDGTLVAFTTTLGTINPLTNTTVSGVATSTLKSGNTVGTATVTAQADTVTGTTDVAFTPGPPYTVTVTADPDSIPIGGFTSTITADITDQWNNKVKDGTVVTFTTDLGILGSSTVTKTTTNGVATAILTSENVTGTATITATADGVSGTTTVDITLVDFSMAGTPISQTVAQCLWVTYTTWLIATPGFDSPVNLSVTNLPTGTVGTFSPNPVTPTATSTLTIRTSPTTPAGAYPLTIQGVGGGITRTTTVTLNVTAEPNPKLFAPTVEKAYQGLHNWVWNTGIQVQNTTNQDAKVVVSYYDAGAVIHTLDTIPANSSKTYYQPAITELPDGFDGSATVCADQAVAAIVNQTSYSQEPNVAGSYEAFDRAETATTLYAPIIFKNYNQWNTQLAVQNAGTMTSTVRVTYHRTNGPGGPWEEEVDIAPGKRHTFDQATNAELPSNFVGSAVIESLNGQPLAAMVNEFKITGIALSYTCFGGGATTVYAPLLFKHYGYANAWDTGLQVQNMGAITTTVTVTYRGPGGPYTETAIVGPGQAHTFYQPANADLPDYFVGSAVITSDQPIVAIVNEVNYVAGSGMSYSCFSGGTKNISTPLLFKRYNNWDTGIQVQNIGAGTTTVTVTYYRSNGPGGPWTDSHTLSAYESYTFYQPANAALPDDFVGSAVITSTTQSIVAIVNEVNYTRLGDTSMSYGGMNY